MSVVSKGRILPSKSATSRRAQERGTYRIRNQVKSSIRMMLKRCLIMLYPSISLPISYALQPSHSPCLKAALSIYPFSKFRAFALPLMVDPEFISGMISGVLPASVAAGMVER